MSETVPMQVIARLHSDFTQKFGIPRQSGLVDELEATVVFEPEFRNPDALRGIEGFSHLWLIWEFSQARRAEWSPTVRPPRLGGNVRMGVFATRSPFRPNPIGLSCVRLAGVELHSELGPILKVRGADLLDGTPIFDIKPYVPYADSKPRALGGFASTPKEGLLVKLLIFRTLLIYLCVLFAMRLMGKRQLGELQPEELVSTILISNLASISIESEEVPVTASLIPLFLIAALELLGSALSFRSQKFFNLMSGRPKTVILDGQIDQNALRTLRLTTADLLEALRGKNIFDPRDVSYAVVETNGSLSAALRPEKETATLADLQLKVEHSHATIPFVLDGQVLEENLHWCGKDQDWLERTAQANTLLPEEILLLVGNETEDYFLLKKESRRKGSSR